MKALIIDLVGKIVDAPDKVQVIETQERDGTFYEIRVADDDIGKVIGRGGAVANAIRTIVKVVALRGGRQANIDVFSDKRLKKAEQFEQRGNK